MKKVFEKLGIVGIVGSVLSILGLLTGIVAAFLSQNADVQLIMRIIACTLIYIGLFMLALKSKKNKGLKALGSMIIAAIISSWILPAANLGANGFEAGELSRFGFADLGASVYYGFYQAYDKILFLFILAGFYGVLSKVSGYQKLVGKIAQGLKNYEIITAVGMSLIITGLTAIVSDPFVVIAIIPFFVSILAHMKVEKITTFAITFGSMLIGVLGDLYNGGSLDIVNYYFSAELTTGLLYRGIILAVAFVLYNFFIVMRLKALRKNKNLEVVEDPFEVEVTRKKTLASPVAILLGILFVVIFLGFIAWETNWDITFFKDIHDKVIAAEVGGVPIFSYIFGQNIFALGEFSYFFTIDTLLIIVGLVLALCYHLKIDDIVSAALEGFKKVLKPIAAFVGIYVLYFVVNVSQNVPVVISWLNSFQHSFNPFLTSLMAFVSSIFSTMDFGYATYMSQALATSYAANIDLIYAIYKSMFGLVQVFLPTGLFLMIGMAFLNVDYKSWLKYIWLFVVGMLIILLLLFSVVLYI